VLSVASWVIIPLVGMHLGLGDASKIDLSTMEQHVTTYCEEDPNAKEFDKGEKLSMNI
jgi:hypothetical protein